VGVAVAHGRAFVSHKRHDDGIRHASILEQRDGGMAQAVKAQFQPCAFPIPADATALVVSGFAEARIDKQFRELIGKRSDSPVLCANDLECVRVHWGTWIVWRGKAQDVFAQCGGILDARYNNSLLWQPFSNHQGSNPCPSERSATSRIPGENPCVNSTPRQG
jgi:hypothetical protein